MCHPGGSLVVRCKLEIGDDFMARLPRVFSDSSVQCLNGKRFRGELSDW